ncbi:16S rRNA (uracil(1498)-N(3))-methyltransferase [Aurantivibrio plasticivorans]
MRIPRLFIDKPLTVGATVAANKETAHYVATVLRIDVGREAVLFNGTGGEYSARVITASKKTVEFELLEFMGCDIESPLHTQLAIGISKGDRMDWVVQKSTELGATAIQPIYTERTEVKFKAVRLEKKLRHWQQIIINACEQSHRTAVPKLHTPLSFNDYLAQCDGESKLILDPHNAQSLDSFEKAPASVSLLVGPEGGFSEEEVNQSHDQGFTSWCLGPRILRTETAPIAALSVLQEKWGDF